MIDQYTEELSASEPIRKLYSDSITNAVMVLRDTAAERREQYVTPELMACRRDEYRNEYAHLLGIDICREVFGTGIPEAELTAVGEDRLCVISRIKLKIYDGIYFTGLLLMPRTCAVKAPLAVMSHGGGGSPELCCDMIGENNYGGVARKLLERGIIVFAPQLLLWNINVAYSGIPLFATKYNRIMSDNELKQCGCSIAGFEIYEITRALDYLLVQDYVDKEKCGMCGLSYGGFYTLYTMAYETRIKSGWSAAFFNDRTKYCWQDFVWKASAGLFLDTEAAGMCAPRRLICDVGKADEVFSNKEVDKLFERVYSFYKASGVPNNVRMNLWSGGHRFSEGDGIDFFIDGFTAEN